MDERRPDDHITYRSNNRTGSSIAALPASATSRSENSLHHSQENTSSNSMLHSKSGSEGLTVPSLALELSVHSQSWAEVDKADDPPTSKGVEVEI